MGLDRPVDVVEGLLNPGSLVGAPARQPRRPVKPHYEPPKFLTSFRRRRRTLGFNVFRSSHLRAGRNPVLRPNRGCVQAEHAPHRSQRSIIQKPLLPVFGDLKLDAITAIAVADLKVALRDDGFAPNYINATGC